MSKRGGGYGRNYDTGEQRREIILVVLGWMAQATGWVEMPRDGFQDAHDGRGRKLHGIADEDKE